VSIIVWLGRIRQLGVRRGAGGGGRSHLRQRARDRWRWAGSSSRP